MCLCVCVLFFGGHAPFTASALEGPGPDGIRYTKTYAYKGPSSNHPSQLKFMNSLNRAHMHLQICLKGKCNPWLGFPPAHLLRRVP